MNATESAYLTKDEFKSWLEKYNDYRLLLERRLTRLESRQWLQIGLVVTQLIATVVLFIK